MGLLDKAKKFAEQAMDKANEAVSEVRSATSSASAPQPATPGGPGPSSAPPAPSGPAEFGTAYVPGMLGRPGWREQGLVDPAALLPIAERDRLGVPHSTKSAIIETPYGMGRRWSAGAKSTGLYYQLYPEHQAWQPASASPVGDVGAPATAGTLDDGQTAVVVIGAGAHRVALEASGFTDDERADLTRTVVRELANHDLLAS